MAIQYIDTPAGRFAVLPEAELQRLVEAAKDAEDAAAVREHKRGVAAGEIELLPAAMVERLIGDESPIRAWREHRGLAIRELSDKAGIAAAYLSQIETGKRDGSVDVLKRLAAALGVTIDDLV